MLLVKAGEMKAYGESMSTDPQRNLRQARCALILAIVAWAAEHFASLPDFIRALMLDPHYYPQNEDQTFKFRTPECVVEISSQSFVTAFRLLNEPDGEPSFEPP
jgi:hypothetical protein